jgi:hypothetical protein
MSIGAGIAHPATRIGERNLVGAGVRRLVGALFDEDVPERCATMQPPIEPDAIDKGNPDLARIEFLDFDLVFDWGVVGAGGPLPREAKPGRDRFVDTYNSLEIATARRVVELPSQRNLNPTQFDFIEQCFACAVCPLTWPRRWSG